MVHAVFGVPQATIKRTTELPSPTQNNLLNAIGQNQIAAFIYPVGKFPEDNLLSFLKKVLKQFNKKINF